MTKVDATIKRIIREKDAAIKTGTEAMRDILKNLHGQVMAELGKAALGSWDAYSLRQYLDSIEGQMANYQSLAKAEAGALLAKSWAAGQSLVTETMIAGAVPVAAIYSGFYISSSVLDVMKGFTFHKFEGLSAAAWDQVKGELTLGIMGGKTPQEVAAAIGKNIDAGKFASIAQRAEVITKTEMGRVFSQASQLRMEQAAEYVPGLEKEWRHVGHPAKPRLTHLGVSGQHVPVKEPFNVGGVLMMFPRDPSAPIEETINCGCDHVAYHANWN